MSPRYAPLHLRIRALAIDAALLAVVLISVSIAVDVARPQPRTERAIWLSYVAGFLLYEPLLVWWRGATIGHAMVGLLVRAATPSGRPSLGRALLRFLAKAVLGIPSFLTVLLTRRHQSIHDLLSKTTMEVSDAGVARGVDFLSEREPVSDQLPRASRRIALILVYEVIVFALISVAFGVTVSASCIDTNACSTTDEVLSTILAATWLVAAAGIVVGGWRGKLWGARAGNSRPAELPTHVT